MARIDELDPDPVRDIGYLLIFYRDKAGDRPLGILLVIQRLHHIPARALRLAVFPLGFKFLNVRGVQKHDAAQRRGSARRKDLPAESMLVKQREQSRVIHVRVRQQNHIDLARRHRDRFILIQIRSLLQSAVDQDLLPARLQIIAASGHFVCRTYKCQFHNGTRPFCGLEQFLCL